MTEALKKLLTDLTVPEQVITTIDAYFQIFVIAAIAVLGIMAIWGYKLFKGILVVGGGIVAGYAGCVYLSPIVIDLANTHGFNFEFIDWTVVVTILCAAVGALLVFFAYRAVIFLMGATLGAFLGYFVITPVLAEMLPDVAFLQSPVGSIIISSLLALIGALIFMLLFKFIFIVASSMGGCAAAIFLAAYAIYPTMPKTVIIIVLAVGAVIGIFPMVRQFKADKKKYGLRY